VDRMRAAMQEQTASTKEHTASKSFSLSSSPTSKPSAMGTPQ
jgi:hypothetical protein